MKPQLGLVHSVVGFIFIFFPKQNDLMLWLSEIFAVPFSNYNQPQNNEV